MTPIVELRHIRMSFPSSDGEITVLHDINLDIQPGSLVTVIGESGCGKSTLGKVCLGTLKPTKGAVFFNGEFIWDRDFSWTPDLRLQVQVIHQDPFASLNPVRTIFQTLSTPFRFYGGGLDESAIQRKVLDLLESVGLAPAEFFMEKYPFQLSGGQKQRVSIARTMIMKPRLIIADEPVSGVDASSRLNILGLMRNLNEEHGIGFLYITHDLATAKYFAPQGTMLVMYLGRIVETGVVSSCIDQPAHPYLQALLTAIMADRNDRDLPLKSMELPSLTDPPAGCTFHPRCLYATDICSQEIPELMPLKADPTHRVACHNTTQVPAWI